MDSRKDDDNSVEAGLTEIGEALLNSKTSAQPKISSIQDDQKQALAALMRIKEDMLNGKFPGLENSSPEASQEKGSGLFALFNSRKAAQIDQEEKAKSVAHLPGWTPMQVSYDKFIYGMTSLLFDHYVVIIVNDWYWYTDDAVENNPELGDDKDVILLAIDLRDNSVQEATIHDRSFFYDGTKVEHCPYTLNKYGDNQIIRYGMSEGEAPLLSLITIESFEPFKVRCENITAEKTPQKDYHTAQVYNDSLYVFGGRAWRFFTDELFKFDLKNHTWEELKLEGSPRSTWGTSSFLYGDNLYIYGLNPEYSEGRPNYPIFALNLKTMSWSRVPQEGWQFINKDDLKWRRLDQSIYKGNLLFMLCNRKTELRCWNLSTNSFRTFKLRPTGEGYFDVRDVFVYKNRLWALEGGLKMNILDLNEVGLKPEETEEEKRFKRLFMKQEGSDITLKVQDKIIPAHKEVLISRSKYFAGLFNSGMTESRENVIEIQDCDSEIFQAFLRYLYCKEVTLNNDLAMKLLVLADKYLQADLSERCLESLRFTLKSENVYEILDFAEKQNFEQLKKICKSFLRNNIEADNLSRLIQYVEKQSDEGSQGLKEAATDFIVKHFEKVYEKDAKNWQFYEDFLIRNVGLDTISSLVNFIYWKDSDQLEEDEKGAYAKSEEKILQSTLHLKQACFDFAKRSFKEIHKEDIALELPNKFLVDLGLFMMRIPTSNLQ